MSRGVSGMAAASKPEEPALPAPPRQNLYKPAAGAEMENSPFAGGGGIAPASSPCDGACSARTPQAPVRLDVSLTKAAPAGAAGAGLFLSGARQEAVSADSAIADAGEGAPAQPGAGPAPAPMETINEASFKRAAAVGQGSGGGVTYAARKSAARSAGATAVRGSAKAGAKSETMYYKPTTSVGGHILGNYTAGDGKAANRFKVTAFRSVPSGDGTKEIWKAAGYGTLVFTDSGRSFEYLDAQDKRIAGPWSGDYPMRLWDIFEYTGKTYLLLNIEHNGKYTFKYYLVEAGHLDFAGAIEYRGSDY